MARLSFRCDDELVSEVDEARGDVPRELWLRKTVLREVARAASNARAAEQALGNRQDDSEQRDLGVRLPAHAPAEQPQMSDTERKGFENLTGVRSEQPSRPLPHYNEGDTLPPAKSQTFPPGPARSSVQAKRDVRPVPKAGEK